MYNVVVVIALLVCLLLILVVLVQNSKGGGLASNFSSSNQVMGVRRTADFLEKATWTLAITLVMLSVLSNKIIKPTEVQEKSRIEENVSESESVIPQDAYDLPSELGE